MGVRKFLSVLAIAFAGAAGSQQAQGAIITNIDFETPDVATSTNVGPTLSTQDYTFTSNSDDLFIIESDAGAYVGSQSLAPFSSLATINITSDTNTAFDALSVDVSELSSVGMGPDVLFTGNLVGGGTVSQTMDTDEVFGLETFNFHSGFTNLSSLDMTGANGTLYQIDNLSVQAIPEPGSLALAAGGLALIAGGRRRGPRNG